MEKIKYEKPVSLNAGEVASVLGQFCGNGSGAPEGCVGGNDPQTAPVCQPGLNATYNCSVGTTNIDGNCGNGGTAFGVCSDGSSPQA